MLRAAPKKRFGRCRALASTPPVSTLPDAGETVLYARARRVIESNKITTSFLCSTKRFAFSTTISATCTCRAAGSSKVLAITSPRTERCISVTSSGRSSMSKTIKCTSGLLAVIECAMFCIMIVLPAFGGDTINPRCPLPIGEARSMTRAVISSVVPLPVSIMSLSCANSGVKFSNNTLFFAFSGASKLISLTFRRAK